MIGWVLLKERPNQRTLLVSKPNGQQEPIPYAEKKKGLNLKAIFVIYFIFGFAYNIYATYFVAYMVEEIRLSESVAGNIWALFGWMCMGSGLTWGFISDRFGRREALLWNNSVIAISVLLPLLLHQTFFLGLSALLFGATFLGTVTVIAVSIGDQVVEKRASVYGLVTLIHGIGQFLGTISGGYLKDLTGSFQLTLTVSLTGFLLCILLTVIHKKR
jgi:predicted MFS family arabinose efflux permease